ncbi:MAG: 50S ribosomal protein L14e [Candidatus Nanoarchaeia archaeon]
MIDIGRVCMKIAGRNAGKIVVVVDKVDDNFVIIDGNVKRKRCNITHLEPLQEVLKIKKGASTEDVRAELKKLKMIQEKEKVKRKPKEKKDATTTKKQRK